MRTVSRETSFIFIVGASKGLGQPAYSPRRALMNPSFSIFETPNIGFSLCDPGT